MVTGGIPTPATRQFDSASSCRTGLCRGLRSSFATRKTGIVTRQVHRSGL